MNFRSLAIGGIVLVAWGLRAQPQNRAPQQPKQSQSHAQREAPASPTSGGTVVYQDNSQQTENHHGSPTEGVGYWHATIKNPDTWLVLVGIATLFFLGWQANETRKSAEAARRSIVLQEAAFDQFVTIGDWKVNLNPTSTVVENVVFTISNQTAYKLTIKSISVAVNGVPATMPIECTFAEPKTLIPKESYPIGIGMHGRQYRLYRDEALLRVSMTVTFRDVLGRDQPQASQGVIRHKPPSRPGGTDGFTTFHPGSDPP